MSTLIVAVLAVSAVLTGVLATLAKLSENRYRARMLVEASRGKGVTSTKPAHRVGAWDRPIATLMVLTSVGILGYWVDYWTHGDVQVTKADWYLRFESSFTVADCWAALCCILGAFGLVRGKIFGLFFTFLASGSLIFLALMDITFNIQNGLYGLSNLSDAMRAEVFINWWTLCLPVLLLTHLYFKLLDLVGPESKVASDRGSSVLNESPPCGSREVGSSAPVRSATRAAL